jgi:hypothetical protein
VHEDASGRYQTELIRKGFVDQVGKLTPDKRNSRETNTRETSVAHEDIHQHGEESDEEVFYWEHIIDVEGMYRTRQLRGRGISK